MNERGTAENLVLRKAIPDDADAIARVFSLSLRLLSFLPKLHSVEEDRGFIANTILKECEVTVALHENQVVAFLARQDAEIRLLHCHPDFIGRGAGSRLLTETKMAGHKTLELWCFQENRAARRFYERHGFRAVKFTDGAHNEEKMPDVRYRWDAQPGSNP